MENNSNNEVKVNEKEAEKSCSQNSDLGWEELDEKVSRVRAENTKRTTAWGLTKFEKWCKALKCKGVEFNRCQYSSQTSTLCAITHY